MEANGKPKHKMLTQRQRERWVRINEGELAAIGRRVRPQVTRAFVWQVFYGDRTSARISAALDRALERTASE